MQSRIEFTTNLEGIDLDCVMECNQAGEWLEEVSVNGVDIYPLMDEEIRQNILEAQVKKMSQEAA